MSWMRTPSRDAAVRSITTLACRPFCSRSVVTSTTCGKDWTLARTRGTWRNSSSRSGSQSVNWYDELDCRPPARMSCAGNMKTRMPPTSSSFGRSRLMTCWELTLPRSDGGFSATNSRPLLTEALKVEAPTDDPTCATAGSDSTIWVARCCSILHRLERDVGRGASAAEDQAGVVLRKEALRRPDVERGGQRDGERGRRTALARDGAAQCRVLAA